MPELYEDLDRNRRANQDQIQGSTNIQNYNNNLKKAQEGIYSPTDIGANLRNAGDNMISSSMGNAYENPREDIFDYAGRGINNFQNNLPRYRQTASNFGSAIGRGLQGVADFGRGLKHLFTESIPRKINEYRNNYRAAREREATGEMYSGIPDFEQRPAPASTAETAPATPRNVQPILNSQSLLGGGNIGNYTSGDLGSARSVSPISPSGNSGFRRGRTVNDNAGYDTLAPTTTPETIDTVSAPRRIDPATRFENFARGIADRTRAGINRIGALRGGAETQQPLAELEEENPNENELEDISDVQEPQQIRENLENLRGEAAEILPLISSSNNLEDFPERETRANRNWEYQRYGDFGKGITRTLNSKDFTAPERMNELMKSYSEIEQDPSKFSDADLGAAGYALYHTAVSHRGVSNEQKFAARDALKKIEDELEKRGNPNAITRAQADLQTRQMAMQKEMPDEDFLASSGQNVYDRMTSENPSGKYSTADEFAEKPEVIPVKKGVARFRNTPAAQDPLMMETEMPRKTRERINREGINAQRLADLDTELRELRRGNIVARTATPEFSQEVLENFLQPSRQEKNFARMRRERQEKELQDIRDNNENVIDSFAKLQDEAQRGLYKYRTNLQKAKEQDLQDAADYNRIRGTEAELRKIEGQKPVLSALEILRPQLEGIGKNNPEAERYYDEERERVIEEARVDRAIQEARKKRAQEMKTYSGNLVKTIVPKMNEDIEIQKSFGQGRRGLDDLKARQKRATLNTAAARLFNRENPKGFPKQIQDEIDKMFLQREKFVPDYVAEFDNPKALEREKIRRENYATKQKEQAIFDRLAEAKKQSGIRAFRENLGLGRGYGIGKDFKRFIGVNPELEQQRKIQRDLEDYRRERQRADDLEALDLMSENRKADVRRIIAREKNEAAEKEWIERYNKILAEGKKRIEKKEEKKRRGKR